MPVAHAEGFDSCIAHWINAQASLARSPLVRSWAASSSKAWAVGPRQRSHRAARVDFPRADTVGHLRIAAETQTLRNLCKPCGRACDRPNRFPGRTAEAKMQDAGTRGRQDGLPNQEQVQAAEAKCVRSFGCAFHFRLPVALPLPSPKPPFRLPRGTIWQHPKTHGPCSL